MYYMYTSLKTEALTKGFLVSLQSLCNLREKKAIKKE